MLTKKRLIPLPSRIQSKLNNHSLRRTRITERVNRSRRYSSRLARKLDTLHPVTDELR